MCGGRKKLTRLQISIIIFFFIYFGPSGSMTPIHLVLRIEYRLSRCLVRQRCCTFHYLLWTYSIKRVCNFHLLILVWLLSRKIFLCFKCQYRKWVISLYFPFKRGYVTIIHYFIMIKGTANGSNNRISVTFVLSRFNI